MIGWKGKSSVIIFNTTSNSLGEAIESVTFPPSTEIDKNLSKLKMGTHKTTPCSLIPSFSLNILRAAGRLKVQF